MPFVTDLPSKILSTLRQNLASLTAASTDPSTTQRTTTTAQPKQTSIAALDALISQHFRDTLSTQVSIAGRALPLIYAIVARLVTSESPHSPSPPVPGEHPGQGANSGNSCGKTVLVVDLEGRFDTTRLSCSEADLKHVYVYRPPRCMSGVEEVRKLVAEAQKWMLYGRHASRGREWWGTIVIGGPGGDINAGWKGWMRVDLDEEGVGFGMGGAFLSAEEALTTRERIQDVVDEAGWVVSSDWGGFKFREGRANEERQVLE